MTSNLDLLEPGQDYWIGTKRVELGCSAKGTTYSLRFTYGSWFMVHCATSHLNMWLHHCSWGINIPGYRG